MVTARSDDGRRQERWAYNTSPEPRSTPPAQELVGVLNGFVRLAAERYRRAGMTGEAIRIYLRCDERPAVVHIADYGPGLSGSELHKLARRLQAGVGTLANTPPHRVEPLPHFGSVAQECEVITLAALGAVPWRLNMAQGFSHYTARADAGALRALAGTDVYLRGVDPDLLKGVTVQGLAQALQLGNHGALLEDAYALQVCGDGDAAWVTTFRAGGVPLMVPPLPTPWGAVHLALSAHETPQVPAAPIILRGDRDLLVLGDLASIPELAGDPWTSGCLSGEVRYACLRRNPLQAGALRHRQHLAALVEALKRVESQVQRDVDDQRRIAIPATLPVPYIPETLAPEPDLEEVGFAPWDALRNGLGRLFGLRRSRR